MEQPTTTPPLFHEIKEIIEVLRQFLTHPLQEIAKLPHWQWRQILISQALTSGAIGLIMAVIHFHFFTFIFQILFTIIISVILSVVSTLFFYYAFQIFARKTVSFQDLYQILYFANLPLMLTQIGASYFPPLLLAGLAFSGFLLVIAFVKKLRITRRLSWQLISGLYILVIAVWLWDHFASTRFTSL